MAKAKSTTFTYEIKSEPNRLGKYCIFLRITQNRKLKRLKSSIELNRKTDFNPKGGKNDNWIRQSEPHFKEWNKVLADEMEKAKATFIELKGKSLGTSEMIVKTMVEGETSSSFLTYAKRKKQDIYNAGGIRNAKRYNGFINKLEAYLENVCGNTDLMFAEITPEFLSKFEAYLHTLPNEREPEKVLHQNTITSQMKIFRAIIKDAIQDEAFSDASKNPFITYKCKREVEAIKEKLTDEELERIMALPLKKGTRIWDARNFFFFAFYCAGIRVGDFIQLRWTNITTDGRLIYQMNKNHKCKDICLVEEAKRILSLYDRKDKKPTDFIFPLLPNDEAYSKAVTMQERDTQTPEMKKKLMEEISSKASIINNNLAKIKKLAGIEKPLTFHISRHSFAHKALTTGVQAKEIQGLLAHSTISVTERYMGNFESKQQDEALQRVFQRDESPKAVLMKKLESLDEEKVLTLLKALG